MVGKNIGHGGFMIEIKNIVKTYRPKKGGEVKALDDVSLKFPEKGLVFILGKSGSGKSTLLNVMGGLDTADSGEIIIKGKSSKEFSTGDFDSYRNTYLGFIFQEYNILEDFNVGANIALALKLQGAKATDEKINEILDEVGLSGYGKRKPNELSGGQKQRVAIARAIVNEPKLLLLDEPLGALDLKMRKDMQIELMDMHKRLGITFVYVTHDQEEALTMSDKIIVMRDGEVQQIGTPKKIYDEPANAFVADFIGESNIMSGIMIDDYKCSFFGTEFECVDKGFKPNEPVDIIVRPEDIYITKGKNVEKGQLTAKVTSCVFKGDHYEILCESDGNELQIVENTECAVGEEIGIFIPKEEIHIMHKARIINEYETEMGDNGIVKICEADFETKSDLPAGTKVKVSIPFDKVDVTDDEADGTVSADVVSSIYKGSYYQVILRTDFDYDFFVDTQDEWLKGDRVGINIKPEDIKVEAI